MRILIVDDESTIHEQLASLIPCEELGWEIIGHAYNGEEARKLTETYRPNLILTDLKMPLMDGLGFMSWLEKSESNAKVIVLSGYGEFEYSRSAFLLGAYDYLLKPVQKSELLLALAKAVEQIQMDTRTESDRINEKAVLGEGLVLMQDEFLTQVIVASITDENEIYVQAQRLLLQLPEFGFVVAIVRFTDFEDQVQLRYEGDRSAFYYAARNAIREIAGSTTLVCRNLSFINEFVLFKALPDKNVAVMEPMLHKLQRSLNEGLKMRSLIGVSACKQRILKISAAYSEAQQALEMLRMAGEDVIALYDRNTKSMPKESLRAETLWKDIGLLYDLMSETGSLRDNDKLIDKLDEAFHEDTLKRTSVSDWKKAVTELIHKIGHYPMNEEMRIEYNEFKASVQALQFRHTKQSLLKWTNAMIARISHESRTKSGKPLIELIRKYIDDNYQTVSLEHIAERFFLNKNYFCTSFKNVAGISFMEYVTRLRMEQAKRLLVNSTLKTYEVATAVGYSDQRYFSQVFRKYTGLQPTQYRQSKPDQDGET